MRQTTVLLLLLLLVRYDVVDAGLNVWSNSVEENPCPTDSSNGCILDVTADIDITVRDAVMELRDEFEGYSVNCSQRTDVCRPVTENLGSKGTVQWPDTQIGTKVFQRCQYAYQYPVFASRVCLANTSDSQDGGSSNQNAVSWAWSASNYSLCPDPPFSIGVQQITNRVFYDTGGANDSETCHFVIASMEDLAAIRSVYSDNPINATDYKNLTSVCLAWLGMCTLCPPLDVSDKNWDRNLRALWTIVNILLDPNYVGLFTTDDSAKFIDYMTKLFPDPALKRSFTFNAANVYAISAGNVSQCTVDVSLPVLEGRSNGTVVTARIQSSSKLDCAHIGSYSAVIIPNTTSVTALKGISISKQVLPSKSPTSDESATVDALDLVMTTDISSGYTSSSFPIDRPISGDHAVVPIDVKLKATSFVTSSIATGNSSAQKLSVSPEVPNQSQSTNSFQLYGPLLHLEFQSGSVQDNSGVNFWRQSSPVQIMLTFQDDAFRRGGLTTDSVLCAVSRITDSAMPYSLKFSSVQCSVVEIQNNEITCKCTQATGYFAVFVQSNKLSNTDWIGPGRTTPTSTLSTFLGFPFNYALYISGIVLRIASLVCLCLTILTCLLIRELRNKTPTRILVNLCFSLIALLVVSYVAEYKAGTRLGCRLSNIFRYYCILVSLFWNGIEAYNMYRMLVQVFNAKLTHFVLTSAIIAWVCPAIAVGCALAADLKAFDGTVIDCTYRCVLKPSMLYYGWLIPMSVIILHNLTIFGLVIRVLCCRSQQNLVKNESKDGVREHWTRLCGAFTLLVLLGVPWIFSAFALIDSDENAELLGLETVFNAAFVIGVNIQGLFIFCFHCARLQVVRHYWLKTVVDCIGRLAGLSRQSKVELSALVPSSSTPRNSSGGTRSTSDTSQATKGSQKFAAPDISVTPM